MFLKRRYILTDRGLIKKYKTQDDCWFFSSRTETKASFYEQTSVSGDRDKRWDLGGHMTHPKQKLHFKTEE